MLPVMYWDDERTEKAKLEEKLRKKREERRGLKTEGPSTETTDVVPVVDRDEIIEQQQKELKDIKSMMLEQSEILREILQKQSQPTITNVITQVTSDKKPVDEDAPVLRELDVDVIDTSGIETVGVDHIQDHIIKGENINSKIAKLKELKKK